MRRGLGTIMAMLVVTAMLLVGCTERVGCSCEAGTKGDTPVRMIK